VQLNPAAAVIAAVVRVQQKILMRCDTTLVSFMPPCRAMIGHAVQPADHKASRTDVAMMCHYSPVHLSPNLAYRPCPLCADLLRHLGHHQFEILFTG